MISGDEFSIQNGYKETKLLLQHRQRPTAIFTLSNTIAIGCIKALREEGIRIPDDISVVTFDDHPFLDRCLQDGYLKVNSHLNAQIIFSTL